MASINCFHLRILILEFLILVLFSICLSSLHGISDSHLSLDYYKKTCPSVEGIVRKEMECACLSDPRNAALILRLHFHDCFVQHNMRNYGVHPYKLPAYYVGTPTHRKFQHNMQDYGAPAYKLPAYYDGTPTHYKISVYYAGSSYGCDGSVLLDDTVTLKGEKNAPNNKNALKGFRIIDRIKNRLESECPGIVSCADILTIAARDAVLLVGGPYWDVPVGRKDSKNAAYELTDTNLPTADEGLISIISKFISQGLSVTDMVALSGAHTIGKARCVNFRNRIYGDFRMTTSIIDPISSSYLSKLKSVCPPIGNIGSDNNETSMDNVTPNLFDNSYYHVLLKGEGLINSDQELYSSFLAVQTKKIVEKYAANTIAFFEQFAESMVKMGNITNPETYVNGEVRKSCRFVNT